MSVKAKLKIILKANETVVAEIEDAKLWQSVLTAINSGAEILPAQSASTYEIPKNSSPLFNKPIDESPAVASTGAIAKFAAELAVSEAVLKGACGPTAEKPFIHLDKHHFEAFKKNMPTRGSSAVGAVVLALTLLVLWKEKAGLGAVVMKEAAGVLDTVGITGKNPTRSVDNCEWLQIRNGSIVLNPAETSKAIKVAKAYCTKSTTEG